MRSFYYIYFLSEFSVIGERERERERGSCSCSSALLASLVSFRFVRGCCASAGVEVVFGYVVRAPFDHPSGGAGLEFVQMFVDFAV